MEVKCSLCGKHEEINKIHKDYQRLAKNPKDSYICWNCQNRVKINSFEKNRPKKPI